MEICQLIDPFILLTLWAERVGVVAMWISTPNLVHFPNTVKNIYIFLSPVWIGSSLQAIVGELLQMCFVKANAFVWKARLSWVFQASE